jgi:AcrR family transcriptional regulator
VEELAPRFTRLEPDARRAQIVDAARELFGHRPFAAVSMSDIADRAGVTRALVHHYFPGKRDLYQAVIDVLLENGPAVIRTDLGASIEDVVAANVAAALDFAQQNVETMSAIAQPGGFDHDPVVAAAIDRAREGLVDRILANHLGTSEVGPEIRLVIRGYLGLFQVVATEWLLRDRATRHQAQTLLSTTLLAMMRDTVPALLAHA